MAGIASPAWCIIEVLEDNLPDLGPGRFCPVKEAVEQGLRVAVAVRASGNTKNA